MKLKKWVRSFFWKNRLDNQKGQTATEYMLIVAVVVLGAVAGASFLIPEFKDGVKDLAGRIKGILTNTTASDKATENVESVGND